jgi:hypothetical protein
VSRESLQTVLVEVEEGGVGEAEDCKIELALFWLGAPFV